jgi:hypothetical protein
LRATSEPARREAFTPTVPKRHVFRRLIDALASRTAV